VKKKTSGYVLGASILVLIAITFSGCIGSKYHFGILVEEYPELLKDRPNYFAASENTNTYSDNSPITLPDSEIKINLYHLSPERPFYLRKAYEDLDEPYLFTVISSDSDQIVSMTVSNTLDGEELQVLKEVVHYWDDADEATKGWRTFELANGFVMGEEFAGGNFVYVARYEYPEGALRKRLNKRFDEEKQHVEIEYYNAAGELVEVEYDLNMHWYKYTDLWQTILFTS